MNLQTELLESKHHFSNKDKEFVLSLLSVDGVGRATARKIIFLLIKHEIDFNQFWVNKKAIWQKSHLSNKIIKSVKTYYKEHKDCSKIDQLQKREIRVLAFWEKEYPTLLKQCDDFPLVLYVKGNIECLHKESIGVVGTRRITSYGRLATKKIVSSLALEGYNIVSGFMYGVDLAAHLEAISNGGTTTAVLGFGFDHMFPAGHQKYLDQILELDGCFITEYSPEVEPIPGNFPNRNRIVAGLSRAVIVIEAAKKSGSHITATCAINEGRDVFAVPGPINNPFSEGTKWLINEGATLITSGNDVIVELKKCSRIPGQSDFGNLTNPTEIQKLIIDELRGGSQTLESLVEILERDASVLSAEVSLLQIDGVIEVEDNQLFLKL